MPNQTTRLVPTPTSVTIQSSGATPLIGFNPTREGLLIINNSAVAINIMPGAVGALIAPVAGSVGIPIASGAILALGPVFGSTYGFIWTHSVQAIAASSTAVVQVLEW